MTSLIAKYRKQKNINTVKYLSILYLTLVKTTQSLIEMLGSNAFKPLIYVIRLTLPYTHSFKGSSLTFLV